ncbi:MAG: hypothetical protein IPK14_16835 [Blastocatellia bacterium]|nr:hypothetical protein [Blastocatellia bacterium]
MSDSLISALLARLGFLVVEYLAEDSFQLIGNSPGWYQEFCGKVFLVPKNFTLHKPFPFIEVFLLMLKNFGSKKVMIS